MPGLFYQPIGRREFLKISAAAGATVVWQSCARGPRAGAGVEEVTFALLSDTHVAGDRERGKDPRGFDPWVNLKQAVEEIIPLGPRGVIVNGDAASREGLAEDYKELKSLLEPLGRVAPIYVGLGNHDDRAKFKEVFGAAAKGDAGLKTRRALVVEESFVRMIVLDSLLYVNKAAGYLGAEQRLWLGEFLGKQPAKATVLFVHHTLGESDGDLLDAGRLFEVIRPHRNVKAIFYGHSHMWGIGEREGVKMINLPALGYNFGPDQPVGWVEGRFHRKGVDLKLRAMAGNRAGDGQVWRVAWT